MPRPRHKPHAGPAGKRDRQHAEQDLGSIATTSKQGCRKQRTGKRARAPSSHGGSEPRSARFIRIVSAAGCVKDDLLGENRTTKQ